MKIKLLRMRHPEYQAKTLEETRALYEGGDTWRKLASRFIVQQELEPFEVYSKRLDAALYVPHAGALCDILTAFLFSEAPTVEGAPSDWWSTWSNDVDREGTPLAWWLRSLFLDAMIGGRAWTWVNLPAVPDGGYPDLKAQEAAGGLNAYLVALRAEHVTCWGRDAQGRLWVVIEDEIETRDDVAQEPSRTLRWRCVDATQIRTWTWKPTSEKQKPEDDDEADEGPVVTHGYGRTPVLELKLPKGLWAMGKLRDPAIALLRGRNGLSWALDRGAHPLLVLYSDKSAKPTMGAGYFLAMGKDDKAGYAEPSGVTYQLLADDLARLREDLYRVVQQMAVAADSNATAAKQSGASKDNDWKAAEIVLAAYAELALAHLRAVLGLVAQVRGENGDEIAVSGLNGWQVEELSAWLEQAAQSVDARQLSRTFRKLVAKREATKLLTEARPEDLAKVLQEIDAADDDATSIYTAPPRPGARGGNE